MSEVQYKKYRTNIKEFLESKAFKPFTMRDFAERFLTDVIKDSKNIEIGTNFLRK